MTRAVPLALTALLLHSSPAAARSDEPFLVGANYVPSHDWHTTLERWDELPRADAIVAAVAHREYGALAIEDLLRRVVKGGAFIDVKAAFDPAALAAAGLRVWRL